MIQNNASACSKAKSLNFSRSLSPRKSNQEFHPRTHLSLHLNSIVAPTLIPIRRPLLQGLRFHPLQIPVHRRTHFNGLLCRTRITTQYHLRPFLPGIRPFILPTSIKRSRIGPRLPTTPNNISNISGHHRRPTPVHPQPLQVVKPRHRLPLPIKMQRRTRRR